MPQDNPPLLDKTMNTTEQTPRNLADVLAEELKNIANNVKPDASDIDLAPISGMTADNVQSGISELKGTLDGLTNIVGLYTQITYQNDIGSYITLSDAVNKYKFLRLMIYKGSISSSTRGIVLVPCYKERIAAGYFVTCINGTLGALRIESQNELDKINILSCTLDTSICIGQVDGIK